MHEPVLRRGVCGTGQRVDQSAVRIRVLSPALHCPPVAFTLHPAHFPLLFLGLSIRLIRYGPWMDTFLRLVEGAVIALGETSPDPGALRL